MRINIKVHARSKRESVTPLPDGSFKVEVKAPPVEGAANEAICELLAEHFKVHKRDVRVVLDETLDAGFSVKLEGGRVEHSFTPGAIAEELAKRLRPDLAKLLK